MSDLSLEGRRQSPLGFRGMRTDVKQPAAQLLRYPSVLRDVPKVVRRNRLVRNSPEDPWPGAHDTTRPVVGFTYKVRTRKPETYSEDVVVCACLQRDLT